MLLGTHAQAQKVRIAVSYFQNTSKDKALDPLKAGLADMLITDLAASNDLQVVERARLNEVLKEIRLQKNPYFDKRTAVRLGKGLIAAYVLVGSYYVSGKAMRIDARFIDVAQGTVAFATKVNGNKNDFATLQTTLSKQLLGGLGATLSLIGKKRIGARSSKSTAAMTQYGRALFARDQGDKKAERKALAKALALDPGFRSVKTRLANMEKKVAALQKSGGLILTPSTARDHLHNARLHAAAGRHQKAAQSAQSALKLSARLVDAWLLLARLPSPPKARAAKKNLGMLERQAVEALFSKDASRLYALMKNWSSKKLRHAGGGKAPVRSERVFVAACAFAFSHGKLPIADPARTRTLYHATTILAAAGAAVWKAGYFHDAATTRQKLDETRRAFKREPKRSLARYGMVSSLYNPMSYNLVYDHWRLRILLLQRPHSDVDVRVTRSKRHPHWRERWASYRFIKRMPLYGNVKQLTKYMDKPGWRIWRLPKPPYNMTGTWYAIRNSQQMSIPARRFRCRRSVKSVTGVQCLATIHIYKRSLRPGCYRVTARYENEAGAKVSFAYPWTWAHEFRFIKSWGPRRLVNWVVHRYPKEAHKKAHFDKDAEFSKIRYTFDRIAMVCPMFAEARVYNKRVLRADSIRQALEFAPYPLKTIAFDVDYKLRGGKRIKAEDDVKAWQAYRRLILRRGHRMRALPYRCQFVPLPPKKPGKRQVVCFVGKGRGWKTPEPDCHTVR
jgi:TolB-like protein